MMHVSWVNHPSMDSHPHKELAKTLFPKGAGSILSFGVKGGREAGAAFMDSLQLATNLANVGDSRTLVLASWFYHAFTYGCSKR